MIYEKFLAGERHTKVGSASFDLPDFIPGDIDICIASDGSRGHALIIRNKIQLLAKAVDGKTVEIPGYPLVGTGRDTLCRVQVGTYDIFVVHEDDYWPICSASKILADMPIQVKRFMSEDKQLRINLFQTLLAKYKEIA